MNGHLIAVEISVETLADQRMQLDGVAFHQERLKSLNAHAVERWGTVQEHRVVANDLLKDVPDLSVLPFEHLLGALDRVGVTEFLQPADDERLVEFQRNFLGQSALVKAERRTDHNHAAGGIIDAFAEEILSKAALFALDHIGQAFQRTIARCEHRPLAAIVIKQCIDRLLEHPLFIADNHLGCV